MRRVAAYCACVAAFMVVGPGLQEAGNATILLRRKRADSDWSIGVLAIVDYALWKQWREESGSNSKSEENIEFYLTHLMNKIDVYYSSISDYDLKVVLQDIRITKSAGGAPWTEDLKEPPLVAGGPNLVNADNALKALKRWLEDRSDTYSQYDHVMLFTGYDLFTPRQNSQKDRTRVGTATIGALCDDSTKISLIEDRRDFSSALIAAHELAHNLDANHDKEENDCQATDADGNPYVMAAFVEASTKGATVTNQFSSCSASQMETFIKKLERDGNNCVDEPASVWSASSTRRYLNQLPGMRFSLQQQCTRVFGGPARFCGYPAQLAEVCKNLICVVDGGAAIDCGMIQVPAFDGTPCGNKKWCMSGACVFDQSAPAAQENCVLGNFIWPIKIGDTEVECGDPRIETLCYNAELRALCCATCESFRDKNQPDCEYGDRRKGCNSRLSCTSEESRRECCRTCPRSSHSVINYYDKLLTLLCSLCVLLLVEPRR